MSAESPVRFSVRAPATSGNIGAGFDCLALTLDLWNEAHIELAGEGIQIHLGGEFTEQIPADETNLIVHTITRRLSQLGVPRPRGLRVSCVNNIPPNSGLGSSSSVLAIGHIAADTIAGREWTPADLMQRVGHVEGHADNAAGVAYGGLVLVVGHGEDYIWRRYEVPPLTMVVVTPPAHYSTRQARALLPQAVPLADAVFNMGRLPLVIEALRNGDLDLLRDVADDRLHQRYRLALTPGAEEALSVATEAGAIGAVVSGSGPSLLAFVHGEDEAARVAEAMLEEFHVAGVQAQIRVLTTSNAAAGIVAGEPAPS
jgi:homoserine kinase